MKNLSMKLLIALPIAISLVLPIASINGIDSHGFKLMSVNADEPHHDDRHVDDKHREDHHRVWVEGHWEGILFWKHWVPGHYQ